MKISQASAYALHALMYMARHVTQLPVTSKAMAKAEGIPAGYLAKVLQQLVKAGFIRSMRGRERGYTFAKPPEEISLLDLFQAMDGEPLFDDCPLRHCACGGTRQNCHIYAQWLTATRRMKELLDEMTIATVAWHHPEHRFGVPIPNAKLGPHRQQVAGGGPFGVGGPFNTLPNPELSGKNGRENTTF